MSAECWKPKLFWGKKVKGQGHNVVLRSSETQYYRCCERKLCWVFLAVEPGRTSSAGDTGCASLPCVRLHLDAGFSPAWVFARLLQK